MQNQNQNQFAPSGAVVAEESRPEAPEREINPNFSRARGPAFYVSPEELAREERIVRAFKAGNRWPKPEGWGEFPQHRQCNPAFFMTPEEVLKGVEEMRADGWKIHPRKYLQFITYGAEE